MGNGDGTISTELLEFGQIKLGVIMIRSALAEVRNERFPGPLLSTELRPPIKGGLATRNPCKVVERGAAAEGLATGVRLLNALIIVTLDQGGLVCPVILAVAEVHSHRRSGNLLNPVRVADPSLNDQDVDIQVLRKTSGDGFTRSAAANNDKVKVSPVGSCHDEYNDEGQL